MISLNDYNALLPFRDKDLRFENGLNNRLESLKDSDLIACDTLEYINGQICEVTWSLTPKGEDALAEFEKCCQNEAKAERQQRFENKISVASVLVPLITFVLGLIIEHYAGIVGLLLSMFH